MVPHGDADEQLKLVVLAQRRRHPVLLVLVKGGRLVDSVNQDAVALDQAVLVDVGLLLPFRLVALDVGHVMGLHAHCGDKISDLVNE